MRTIWMAGLALAGLGAAAQAQQVDVTGGELRFGYERALDGGGGDTASKTSLEGAMSFGFGDRFGAQADLALDRFNADADYGQSLGVHGAFAISEMTHLGAFAGYETAGGADVTYFGGEVAVETGVTAIEGYVLSATEHESGAEGTVWGLQGHQAVTPRLDLGGRLNLGTFDADMDVTRMAVTAGYALTPAGRVEAELGSAEVSVPGLGRQDDAYLAVQATFAFGPGQGATFGRRGLLDLLLGG